MTYKAIVTRITVRPHPNADAIQLGTCRGNQVVVGLDVKTGDMGVFFATDGALSQEFCDMNNLIAIHDATGKKVGGGFFDKNRRVRSQKFRGERSDGFWVPLSYFAYALKPSELHGMDDKFVEGFEFDELNGHPICNKYVTPATARAILNQKAQPRRANVMFAKHTETEKWRDRSDKIPTGALIVLTEKLHGCVEASTVIDTLEYGDVPISKIVDEKLHCHVKSLDTESGDVVYQRVADWYFCPNDSDWYEIELENGEKITITGNNPIWLPRLKCYRRVDELATGDYVLKS